jgi:hypothetical protein
MKPTANATRVPSGDSESEPGVLVFAMSPGCMTAL